MMAQQGPGRQRARERGNSCCIVGLAMPARRIPLQANGPAGAIASAGLIRSDQAGAGPVRDENDHIVALATCAQWPAATAAGAVEIIR